MDCRLPDRYGESLVKRSRHAYRSPMHARVLRSDVARWLVVVLIAPMLLLGAFNGATFLAHRNHEHGVHLHPIGLLHSGVLAMDDHASCHGHDDASLPAERPAEGDQEGDQGGDELKAGPCCFIVCLDVQKQLPTRNLGLRKSLFPEAVCPIVAHVAPKLPQLDLSVGSRSGSLHDGPMHLILLGAGDRLVRTSRALLI